MAVEVRLPGPLEAVTGGKRVVTADGSTVGEVLARLSEQYPGLRERLLTAEGQVQRFVNIYLNDEDIRFIAGMDTAVNEGDVIAILPALAGGSSNEIP
ncbi:MAG: MoaD family protein [Chloroflexi bacterium]|nr:MoaD family protein [Chloroflexota bacterium]GIW10978.1 MAG: MoaD family protein [Dehalococcoidia bacterium]